MLTTSFHFALLFDKRMNLKLMFYAPLIAFIGCNYIYSLKSSAFHYVLCIQMVNEVCSCTELVFTVLCDAVNVSSHICHFPEDANGTSARHTLQTFQASDFREVAGYC